MKKNPETKARGYSRSETNSLVGIVLDSTLDANSFNLKERLPIK